MIPLVLFPIFVILVSIIFITLFLTDRTDHKEIFVFEAIILGIIITGQLSYSSWLRQTCRYCNWSRFLHDKKSIIGQVQRSVTILKK